MFETGNLKIEYSEGLKCGYGLNWYVYANNNPLRFVDPTGLTILDVKGDSHQQDSSVRLGTEKSNTTINKEGCVLESAVRIAREISGNEDLTLEDANIAADKLNLFSGKGQDELSTEAVAKLITGLTGKEIGYGSYDGSDQSLKDSISYLDSSKKDYYVTARIDTHSIDDTSDKYEHTVSVNEGLTQRDYQMGKDQQPVVDTSTRERTEINDGFSGTEELTRVDYFYVKED